MSVADRVIPPWYARLPTDVAGRLCGKAQLPALVMSLFVIDSLRQTGYTPTAPEGVSGKSYLKIKQTAVGNWQLAKVEVATLCRYVGIGFGIGWPLGHPRATQGPPKGHPSVTQGPRKGHPSVDWQKVFCLQQKLEKGRVGWCLAERCRQKAAKIAGIAEIARLPTPKAKTGLSGDPVIARDRKSKTSHGSTRTQRIGIRKRRSPNATTETRLSWGYLSSSSLSSSSSRPPLASRSRRAPSPAAPRCSPATLPSRSITT
jgi:hypothetical protein